MFYRSSWNIKYYLILLSYYFFIKLHFLHRVHLFYIYFSIFAQSKDTLKIDSALPDILIRS